MKEYTRNCPQCKRKLVYPCNSHLWAANKSNSKCHSCASMGNKSCRGRVYAEEQKDKIRQSNTGQIRSEETCRKIGLSKLGIKHSVRWKQKMSQINRKRYSDQNEVKKMSESVRLAMHRPDVRKKHIKALRESGWLKTKTDKGQIELLEKWNRLGFKFETNYQVHTDMDLFYIDGYDPAHNVVIEYDSKYHQKLGQQKRDLIRQQKIIDILQPKKFWRYNAIKKQCENVLESIG